MARAFTNRAFADELPRLLEGRGVTLRALAREVGGLDHAYLSRMLSGKVAINPRHVAAIARALDLPEDYFPEVREMRVIAAITTRPRLRDEIYFDRVVGRRRR
jgi:transcriptional regulator with XRE-family HTH domain